MHRAARQQLRTRKKRGGRAKIARVEFRSEFVYFGIFHGAVGGRRVVARRRRFYSLWVGLGLFVVVCGRFAWERRSELAGAHRGEGRTVGDRHNPSLCKTGAGTSGVPAASFARRRLTARVCVVRTKGRESRRRSWSAGGERGSQ